jgi:hypothetical protein
MWVKPPHPHLQPRLFKLVRTLRNGSEVEGFALNPLKSGFYLSRYINPIGVTAVFDRVHHKKLVAGVRPRMGFNDLSMVGLVAIYCKL